jgi:hypothetical protein
MAMNKKTAILFAILALSLYACGGEDPQPNPEPTPTCPHCTTQPPADDNTNPLSDGLPKCLLTFAYARIGDWSGWPGGGYSGEITLGIQADTDSIEPNATIKISHAESNQSITTMSENAGRFNRIYLSAKGVALGSMVTITVSNSTCKTSSQDFPVTSYQ